MSPPVGDSCLMDLRFGLMRPDVFPIIFLHLEKNMHLLGGGKYVDFAHLAAQFKQEPLKPFGAFDRLYGIVGKTVLFINHAQTHVRKLLHRAVLPRFF